VVTHTRETAPVQTDGLAEAIKDASVCTLSGILNAMDGMFSANGRILIATTNHIEKLDAALIRPGRIDLKLEVGFVNEEILREFFTHFFPKEKVPDGIAIKDGITVAQLQGMVLSGNSAQKILAEIRAKSC
jgi:chaperone BCS1